MNIPFLKIADRVEVTANLKGKRISGLPPNLPEVTDRRVRTSAKPFPDRSEPEDYPGGESKVVLRSACELRHQIICLNQAPMNAVY
jgi:hypothetical protein